jgi:ribosomal RNA-processing protein 17
VEYIDEDKYTMVTVEDMDLLRDHTYKVGAEEEDQGEAGKSSRAEHHEVRPSKPKKRMRTKENQKRPKKKRKKFRYESKAERKITRFKERSRNKAKVEARRSR